MSYSPTSLCGGFTFVVLMQLIKNQMHLYSLNSSFIFSQCSSVKWCRMPMDNSSVKDIFHVRTVLMGFVLEDGLQVLSHLQATGFTCALHIIKFLTQFENHSILIERNARLSSGINVRRLLESEK